MVDSSVIALIVVGIIGFCLLNKSNDGSKMLTWGDVGKILLIFAIVEGLMYLVAPLPVRIASNNPIPTIKTMIFEGGRRKSATMDSSDNEGVGGAIMAGSVLDSVNY